MPPEPHAGSNTRPWNGSMISTIKRTIEYLESCDQPLDENGECPGKTVKLTYPEALERMLKENGYKVEK